MCCSPCLPHTWRASSLYRTAALMGAPSLSTWATSGVVWGGVSRGHNNLELLDFEGKQGRSQKKNGNSWSVNLFGQVAFFPTFG